jgi:hypothetical protein
MLGMMVYLVKQIILNNTTKKYLEVSYNMTNKEKCKPLD